MHRHQYYPCDESWDYWPDHAECDKTWFGHYKVLDVDLLLDADTGILKLGVVGHTQKQNEHAMLFNIPIPGQMNGHKGYVPQFIFAYQYQEMMMAEIPVDWYGQPKDSIFSDVIRAPPERWISGK